MANTLITPVTIVAPLVGGWLADSSGFHSTFIAAALAGLLNLVVLHWLVTEPGKAGRLEAARLEILEEENPA
jgi:MFS family permease